MGRTIILYIAFLLLLNSCTRCKECCDYLPNYQTIDGQSYGSIFLDLSRDNWIPKYTSHDSILFVNSIGGQESYVYHQATKRVPYKVDLYPTRLSGNCGNTNLEIKHHGMAEEEYLICSSYIPIIQKLQMNRAFSVDYKMDSTAFLQAPEYFMINWNNMIFSPDLNNYTNQPSKKFHASLTLNGHVYDSVFECYQINADPNYIGPEGFYYSKKDGFVGFYISRHLQEWLKK